MTIRLYYHPTTDEHGNPCVLVVEKTHFDKTRKLDDGSTSCYSLIAFRMMMAGCLEAGRSFYRLDDGVTVEALVKRLTAGGRFAMTPNPALADAH